VKTEQPYHGPERRDGHMTEDRVRLLIQQTVDNSMKVHEARIEQLIKVEFGKMETLFKSAFPEGDPYGHRAAHEKQIRDATKWDKIKAEFISKAFSTGILAAVGFALIAVWEHYIKRGGA
jgi:hypothetical protein